eukprot:2726336-Alexandrium_andersonii.AAC.1
MGRALRKPPSRRTSPHRPSRASEEARTGRGPRGASAARRPRRAANSVRRLSRPLGLRWHRSFWPSTRPSR